LGGEWDYEKYIGRQMNSLTIGTIGYGRLGGMYAKYCKAFDSKVLVYDPYKKVEDKEIIQVDKLDYLLKNSDVIAIHVHVTDETIGMINKACFDIMKKDVVLVNTARGDMVNELDLVSFLKLNPGARIATDVLANEIKNKENSPLLKYSFESDQVIITPHIGGMCREAQEIAYGHSAKRLYGFIKSKLCSQLNHD
jgi:D-3-phosphoglycerate dehydrogenase